MEDACRPPTIEPEAHDVNRARATLPSTRQAEA